MIVDKLNACYRELEILFLSKNITHCRSNIWYSQSLRYELIARSETAITSSNRYFTRSSNTRANAYDFARIWRFHHWNWPIFRWFRPNFQILGLFLSNFVRFLIVEISRFFKYLRFYDREESRSLDRMIQSAVWCLTELRFCISMIR